MKDEFDKHIRFDNNNNEGEKIENQNQKPDPNRIIKNISTMPLKEY